jgi:ankyrin repeat protein
LKSHKRHTFLLDSFIHPSRAQTTNTSSTTTTRNNNNMDPLGKRQQQQKQQQHQHGGGGESSQSTNTSHQHQQLHLPAAAAAAAAPSCSINRGTPWRQSSSSATAAAATASVGLLRDRSVVSANINSHSFDNASYASSSYAFLDASSPAVSCDISQFQDSWANTNGQDFLGGGGASVTAAFGSGGGGGSVVTDFQSFLGNNSMRSSLTSMSLDFTAPGTGGLGGPGGGSDTIILMANERPMALSRNISLSPRVVASSEIHNAARITDWDRVLELCASNPEQAKYTGALFLSFFKIHFWMRKEKMMLQDYENPCCKHHYHHFFLELLAHFIYMHFILLFTGADGWTALHHACNRRCPRPEVVEALIKAYPDALMTEEEKGWLPLHYACRFKAPKDVVSLLLHMHPEKGKIGVSKKDNLGRTPLYYAVRYDAPPGVLGVLLKVNPAAVLEEDQHDDSPLALVWTQWAEKLEAKRIIHSFLPPHPEGTSEQERAEFLRMKMRKQPKLLQRWNKVNMLLKAAFGFPVDDKAVDDEEGRSSSSDRGLGVVAAGAGGESEEQRRKWRIVHATAAVKCHLSLFLLACALHPEQARELDESDLQRPGDPIRTNGVRTNQTALHLAASSNATGEMGKSVVHRLLGLYRDAAQVQDSIDGSLPLHRMVENPVKQNWPEHAAVLYHVNPRAVQVPDFNGKLVLHRAAAAISHMERDGQDYFETSVIINVVRSHPQAASHADSARCLPLHYIAMNAHIWDAQVEAVYNAYRAAAQARAGPEMDNRLALHMAAANEHAQGSLISKLVALHPRGASIQDRQGRLPLHLACEIGKEWNEGGLEDLYEAFPDALQQAEDNERHWYALHMAVNNESSSSSLIQKLVELYPQAAARADGHGRYPLHLACGSGRGWEDCLGLLFEACPSALSQADVSGMLPFHIAALRYCHTEPATQVVTLPSCCTGIPESAEDNSEDMQELAILFQLLRADPTVLDPRG